MTDMVERVALATCVSKPCICKNFLRFDGMPCLDRGRAAISAMREPTAEMLSDAYCDSGGSSDVVWRAMIDSALKERA